MIRTKSILTIALLATTIVFTSCEKDFDAPPVRDIAIGEIKTIAEVKAFYVPGEDVYITTDISVYGVVTMDETTGNLYKEAYMQDVTGGMNLRFTATSGLYVGDSIRVNLNGAKILKYNNMFQVDDLDPDNNIVKQSTQNFRTPEITDISSINAQDSFYQGRLIQLNSVEFECLEMGYTWADAVGQGSEDRYLQDTTGGPSIIVRSSGYANFAGDVLPSGRGSFIGIVSQYNGTMQLLVRDPSELTLYGARNEICPILTKNFDDGSVTSGGWTIQNVVSSETWTPGEFPVGSGSYFGLITNTNAQLAVESWLISPSMNLTTMTNPYAYFRTATFAANSDLEFYVSTNYDGVSAPSSATWNLLSAAYSTGGWSWTGSGNLMLTSYIQPSVHVAFKYTGTTSAWTTWEVDNISISE